MAKDKAENSLMEKIVSLCKRRGFIFPGSEIYGGLANSWDYGPLGVELKNNIKNLWWKIFVRERDDMVGIDASLLMNPRVWEASGHLKEFSDPLVECKHCHERFRVNEAWSDEVWWNLATNLEKVKVPDREKYVQEALKECPKCGAKKEFTIPKQFNLMFKTHIGSTEDKSSEAYFRPETAQGIFVNFKNVLNTTRKKLPFGIAQVGKAFRNEITPGNFIFRTREFEQMEIEYFISEKDWKKWFEYWQKEIRKWLKEDLGINYKKVHEIDIPAGEMAHYSKCSVDFEYEYPFGQKELYGLAYRTDFDLRNHESASGTNLKYRDPDTNEEFWPHVIEPSLGVDRTVLAVLLDAYSEEGEGHVILKLKPQLAPYKAAVFPLLANKPELTKVAREIYDDLRKDPPAGGLIAWDDRGNIGKRYFSQDEIGTPYCITVDFETLENPPAGGDVTVRDRDTGKQERIKIDKLKEYLNKKLE